MAVQNSTITVKGKLGNIVGYKGRSGKRLARIRQTVVKNPKTIGQITQRMILATASKAYARLKSITDHSFQGVSYGGESQSYFLKRAMEVIRVYVADSLAKFPESITDPNKYVGLAMPNKAHQSGIGLLVSEGSIPSIAPLIKTKKDDEGTISYVAGFGKAMSVTKGEVPTITQVLNAFGAQVGDQITLVCLIGGQLVYSRYVIDINASATALAEGWESDGSSTAFDAEKTEISRAELGFNETDAVMKPSIECDAAAVIISRKTGTVWQRSTQYLLPMAEDIGQNVQAFIDMWKISTTKIPNENPYYLNNADV